MEHKIVYCNNDEFVIDIGTHYGIIKHKMLELKGDYGKMKTEEKDVSFPTAATPKTFHTYKFNFKFISHDGKIGKFNLNVTDIPEDMFTSITFHPGDIEGVMISKEEEKSSQNEIFLKYKKWLRDDYDDDYDDSGEVVNCC